MGKKLEGYRVYVYTTEGHSDTMNLLKKNSYILVTDGINGDSSEVNSDDIYLKLVKRNIMGKEYVSVEPVNVGEGDWKMFSGKFVWSSDSRFRKDVSERPLPVHDRVEKLAKGGKLSFKERSEKDSLKLSKAYQKVLESNFDDKIYNDYQKLVKETKIPKEQLQKIETYISTTPKGNQRMIDIYQYWANEYADGGSIKNNNDYMRATDRYDLLGALLDDAREENNTTEMTKLREQMEKLETEINRYERNYAKGGKIKEVGFENSNLYLYGFGKDSNGNSIVKIGFPNQRAFSIQTNGVLNFTHDKRGYSLNELTKEDIEKIEKEVVEYVKEYGSKEQKSKLKTYSKFVDGGSVGEIEAKIADYRKRAENKSLPESAKNKFLSMAEELEKTLPKAEKKEEAKAEKPKKEKKEKAEKKERKEEPKKAELTEKECEDLLAKYKAEREARKERAEKREKQGKPAELTPAETAKKAVDRVTDKIDAKAEKGKSVKSDIKAVFSQFKSAVAELKKYKNEIDEKEVRNLIKELESLIK